jgi:hypothetical protein
MLNRLAIVPRCFAALWDSRRWQNGQRSTIPSLAVIGRYFFERPALTPRSGARKDKARPVRRFESVRRYSLERLRTPPSPRGLDRIETVIQDETARKAQ